MESSGNRPSRWAPTWPTWPTWPTGIDVLVLALVAALSFAAFLPALRAEFVNLDDDRMFLENSGFRGFDLPHLRWMFTTSWGGHYIPLTWLSHALDFAISGLDPASYHAQNLVLHALDSVLVALLVRRLIVLARPAAAREHPSALRLAAGAAALLFAVHPLRVESVAWATERRDVLCAFLLLLATLAWLSAFAPVKPGGGEPNVVSKRAYVAALACLSLSLLAKGWGMTFVLIAVALDVWPLRRLPPRIREWGSRERRAIWIQKLPLLGLAVLAAGASAWAQRSAGAMVRTLDQWSLGARAAQACYGLAFYAWKTIWPRDLAALYELPFSFDPLEPRFLAGYVALTAGAVLLLCLRRPALTVATCIYAALLLPVLGFFQSGPQLVADRYSYLACLPWAALVGGGLFLLWSRDARGVWTRPARWASAFAVVVLLPLLILMTWRQTQTWRDSRTMWSHALDVGQPSALAHVGLGFLDAREGHVETSLEHFRAAVKIRPDYGSAWFNLGMSCSELGLYEEAENAWIWAARTSSPSHPSLTRLGMLYLHHMDRPEEGIACLRQAAADAESSGDGAAAAIANLRLGVALQELGRAEAGRPYLEAAARHPGTRGEALRRLGRSGT